MTNLYVDAVAEIRAAYARLGHQRGWRFLATPRRTLHVGAEVAFVTLNPGGSAIDPSHGVESCEEGSAYVRESWDNCPPGKSPLQRQVRGMFEWLGLDPDQTLSAYFIPFRSPSLDTLAARRESETFAVGLWTRIFAVMKPALVVCIGNDVEKALGGLFRNQVHESRHAIGWGDQAAVVRRYSRQVLLRLPHLSRFAIFGREPSKEPLRLIRAEVEKQRAMVRE